MTNSVVLGVEGDAGLYMVNLEARTVELVSADQASLFRARAGGQSVINGVNLAVRVSEAPTLSAGVNEAH